MANNNQNRNNNNHNKNNNFKNDEVKIEKVFDKDGNIDIENTIIKEINKYKNNKYAKDNIPTTTQLRLLLSNSVVVKNKIDYDIKNNSCDVENYKLSDSRQNDIKYLLIKHIYQCGRDKSVKIFDEGFEISKKLKEIGDSKSKFDQYYRYLEEIVAYVKYYKEDKEK